MFFLFLFFFQEKGKGEGWGGGGWVCFISNRWRSKEARSDSRNSCFLTNSADFKQNQQMPTEVAIQTNVEVEYCCKYYLFRFCICMALYSVI